MTTVYTDIPFFNSTGSYHEIDFFSILESMACYLDSLGRQMKFMWFAITLMFIIEIYLVLRRR